MKQWSAIQDCEGRGAGAARGGQHDGDGVGRGDGGDRPEVDDPVVVVADFYQRWTDQCDFGHDSNRRLLDGTYCGQNAASGYGSMNSTVQVGRPKGFQFSCNAISWKHFPPSLPARAGTVRWRTWRLIVFRPTPRIVTSISLGIVRSSPLSTMSFPRSGVTTGTTGHYTQVVWAESSRLGCGKRDRYVVCNYLGGNMSGSSIYKRVNEFFRNSFLFSTTFLCTPTNPGSRLLRLS